MRETFEIHPSTSQLVFMLGAHLAAAVIVFFYIEAAYFKWPLLLLAGLLAWCESKRLIQQQIMTIRVGAGSPEIELEQGGQPYFYAKYKVYANRWFAILKLVNQAETRTLILNSDCFSSTRQYRRLRFCLCLSEFENAA